MLDEKQNETLSLGSEQPTKTLPRSRTHSHVRVQWEDLGRVWSEPLCGVKSTPSDHGINITLYKHTGIMIWYINILKNNVIFLEEYATIIIIIIIR